MRKRFYRFLIYIYSKVFFTQYLFQKPFHAFRFYLSLRIIAYLPPEASDLKGLLLFALDVEYYLSARFTKF